MKKDVKEPKKRGRKPKNEYYLNKQPDNVSTENGAIIIHLPITIEKCREDNNLSRFSDILSSAPNELTGYLPPETTLFKEIEKDEKPYNIEPISEQPICSEITYISEKTNTMTEIYDSSLIPTEVSSMSNFTVDICCYWCCHKFDNKPIFMPVSFDTKKQLFKVKGCFCSFNCCLAYNQESMKYRDKRYLLSYMYRIFTGSSRFSEKINKAPPREVLKMFGGNLNIEEFRNTFTDKTHFIIHQYPITYIPTQIKKTSFIKKEKEPPRKILPMVQETSRPFVSNSLSKIIKNFK